MQLSLADSGVIICPVGPEALPALVDLYRECEDFLALGPDPHASESLVLRDLDSMRAEGAQYHGIFSPAGVLLGVLDVIPQGHNGWADGAYIELLMLRASARGVGLGQAVLAALEAHLIVVGVRQVEADVQVNNPAAQRFWQRMGYERVAGPTQQADSTITYLLRKQIAKR